MLYPKTIEEKTGFNEIRKLVTDACVSSIGSGIAERMSLSTDIATVRLWLEQTDEMMSILSLALNFPDKHYIDARDFTTKVKAEGSYLIEEEWFKLKLMLESAEQLIKFFNERKETYPQLASLIVKIPFEARYISEIDRCIDSKGHMKPTASKELYEIIQHIQSEEASVRKKVHALAKKVVENAWGPENNVTIRNDRLVLSIYAEHKRKVTGLIHDESSTGQTFYIEPAEIFELNNYIKELHLERQREIRKILIELTNKLRPAFPMFEMLTQKMGLIDFIRAKGILGIKLKAAVPQIDEKLGTRWISARHPLLYLHNKKQNRKVVAFDLELSREKRILVVSGPNAGGKSVLLKAVGLLQLMVQHGLPVSASADSKIGLYKQIFADIGDQQSIDNDLSTYSSHLANMKHFMTFATSKTLFLIDEMGTGTDPLFGGPMAEAILEQLNKKFSYGIVTTHFSNLKMFANATHGLTNGSMVFDNDALQPLYMFDDGKPGSSYTFEIAGKSGIDKDIIQNAKKKAGNKLNQTDTLLIDLEREKTYIKNLKEDLEKTKVKTDQHKTEYELLKTELQNKKANLLKEAKSEALKILTDAKKTVENTVREIKENQASTLKSSRKPLDDSIEALEQDLITAERRPTKKGNIKNISAGDKVKIDETGREAEVISISKDKAIVMIGNIQQKVAVEQLEKVLTTKVKEVKRSSTNIDMNARMATFNAEINIIGMRGGEAMAEVMRFIDEAIMLGHDKIRIVHGRGAGILKNLVRNELKKIASIKHYGNESEEFGGDAITVVTFS